MTNNQQIIKNCHVNESEFFQSYLIAYRYHLTNAIPYHVIEFPFYEWISILMTYSWNFIDLFIILISVCLATRFNQINDRLASSCLISHRSERLWNEIRVDYYALIDLVDEIDKEISMLVLLSTGHNLFSICVKIFESLTR
jgi:gustatory receptor